MKIKEEINLDILLTYGFVKIDKEQETEDELYTVAAHDYKFQIGYARRGNTIICLSEKQEM